MLVCRQQDRKAPYEEGLLAKLVARGSKARVQPAPQSVPVRTSTRGGGAAALPAKRARAPGAGTGGGNGGTGGSAAPPAKRARADAGGEKALQARGLGAEHLQRFMSALSSYGGDEEEPLDSMLTCKVSADLKPASQGKGRPPQRLAPFPSEVSAFFRWGWGSASEGRHRCADRM